MTSIVHPQIKTLSVMALYDDMVMSSQENWLSVASESGILFVLNKNLEKGSNMTKTFCHNYRVSVTCCNHYFLVPFRSY